MLKIVAGFDADFDLDLRARDGTIGGAPVTAFDASDALGATLWPGDDQPATFAPAMAWVDAANGKARITFPAAATASLDEGVYSVRAWVDAGGERLLVLDDQVAIEAAAATGSADWSLVSLRDLKALAPWVEGLAPRDGTAGFARQRAEATRWLVALVVAHYRGNASGLAPLDYSLDHLYYGLRRSPLPPADILGWIAAGGILLDATDTATGKKADLGVREVVARYALGLVCAAQLGPKAGNEYARFARMYLAQAEDAARSLTVMIDTNGDGVADVAVSLGLADTLYC